MALRKGLERDRLWPIVNERHLMFTIVVESGRKWSKGVRLCLKLSIVVESSLKLSKEVWKGIFVQ